ncbi:phosphoenolpyruvate protein kinase [Paenibacillus thiaminolyticus]|uniref:Phosphoenolpyruvate protein kinase n=1 Tax=Paenibacillus thiaminolyticus TaxID=49283 RepID=A0A3A3GG21_PANTH|nr:phosphoenolpyruvate protein kinase [Paenibacillus thiaminolyticus]RJG21831.1 phosphoenolpyruvate protein kinase [Paenibacillus thiaminolyticus]
MKSSAQPAWHQEAEWSEGGQAAYFRLIRRTGSAWGHIWDEDSSGQRAAFSRTVMRCWKRSDIHVALSQEAAHILLTSGSEPLLTPERIRLVREMLQAANASERSAALDKLVPFMTSEYESSIKAASSSRPVHLYIILADARLKEALPSLTDIEQRMEVLQRLAAESEGRSLEKVNQQWFVLRRWKEWLLADEDRKPAFISDVVPDWIDMQAEALFRAVDRCYRNGSKAHVTVMLPYQSEAWEKHVHMARSAAEQIMGETAKRSGPLVGLWITGDEAGVDEDERITDADIVWRCSFSPY